MQRLQVALAFLTLVRNLSPLTVPKTGAHSHLGHLLHLEVPSPGFLVLPGNIQDIRGQSRLCFGCTSILAMPPPPGSKSNLSPTWCLEAALVPSLGGERLWVSRNPSERPCLRLRTVSADGFAFTSLPDLLGDKPALEMPLFF